MHWVTQFPKDLKPNFSTKICCKAFPFASVRAGQFRGEHLLRRWAVSSIGHFETYVGTHSTLITAFTLNKAHTLVLAHRSARSESCSYSGSGNYISPKLSPSHRLSVCRRNFYRKGDAILHPFRRIPLSHEHARKRVQRYTVSFAIKLHIR